MTNEYDSELWVPVYGYEGWYEVSNFGRVRSVPRVVKGRWGATKRLGCMLAIKPANERYLKVSLCKDGLTIQHQVHRLVLLSFIGEPPKDFVCDHIDCDIKNNNLNNLRWLSSVENVRRKSSVKLSVEIVSKIKEFSRQNKTPKQIATELDVKKYLVNNVLANKSWKEVQ